MKKVRYTLLEELRKVFPEKRSIKKLESWMEKLSSLQWALAPRKEFKEALLWRLEGMSYMVETDSWKSSVKTFWWWYAMMLGSLFVVVGVSYTFFDIRSTSYIELPLQDEWIGQIDNKAGDHETQRVPQDITEALKESDVVTSSSPTQDIRREDTLKIDSIPNNEIQQEKAFFEQDRGEIVPKQQSLENEPPESFFVPSVQKSSLMSNEASIWVRGEVWWWVTEDFLVPEEDTEIRSEVEESQYQNIAPMPAIPINTPTSPESSTMNAWVTTEEINDGLNQSTRNDFERICVTELWWELIEEKSICLLETGETCDSSGIYTCGQEITPREEIRTEWDIYLEDYLNESQ